MHLYNVEDWKKHTEGKHHVVNMSREGSQQQDVTRKSGTPTNVQSSPSHGALAHIAATL